MTEKAKAAAPMVAVLTMAVVATMIAEAVKGLVTAEQLKTVLAEVDATLVTTDQVQELISASQDAIIDYVHKVHPAFATPETTTAAVPSQPPLDPAWLEGLTFSGATQEKRIVEGRPRLVATPFERELQPEDVLGYRVTEDQVFLVTADGKKYTVEI